MYKPIPVFPNSGSTPHPHIHFPFTLSSMMYVCPGASLPKRCSAKAIVMSVSETARFISKTFLKLSSWWSGIFTWKLQKNYGDKMTIWISNLKPLFTLSYRGPHNYANYVYMPHLKICASVNHFTLLHAHTYIRERILHSHAGIPHMPIKIMWIFIFHYIIIYH